MTRLVKSIRFTGGTSWLLTKPGIGKRYVLWSCEVLPMNVGNVRLQEFTSGAVYLRDLLWGYDPSASPLRLRAIWDGYRCVEDGPIRLIAPLSYLTLIYGIEDL